MQKIGLFIPTQNAGDLFKQVLQSVSIQSLQPHQKLIIDSGSTDQTLQLAAQHNFQVYSIPSKQYNHGGTRNFALQLLQGCDVVIFLTQDVILATDHSLQQLIDGLLYNDNVSATYGRQLPHVNATAIAAFERAFNYPNKSRIQNTQAIPSLGYGVCFCSNSFAAYRVQELKQIGGFPTNTVFGEDAYVAAKLVQANKAIFYNADALVHHSHNYNLKQQLQRYVDMGIFFQQNNWMSKAFGKPKGKALTFIFTGTKYLLAKRFTKLPNFYALIMAKYLGYKVGINHRLFPQWLVKRMSANKAYFEQ